MVLKESTALKLISEMKKLGRECLYGLSSKGYRNNHLKQGLWLTIATSIGIERSECQALWKSLRRRYKTAKTKNTGRSGSERVEFKGFLKILVSEMEYIQKFWEDDDPSVTNYVDGNTTKFRELFDEMAQDLKYTESPTDTSRLNPAISLPPSTSNESQKRKRLRLADAEVELDKSLKTLNILLRQ
ncbi:hypothetical protein DOY81_013552 [Sarcophaga bullata]|nr:hypothetical protein DOY81_013552 [Sarcophaga bullata]